MARGKAAKEGDTRVAPNKYHYTRTATEWRLTHHIIAEQKLGRPLRDDERVSFKDRNRNNLSPDNLIIQVQGSGSVARRRAQIVARMSELQAELDSLPE
jgi:hypothetical protein